MDKQNIQELKTDRHEKLTGRMVNFTVCLWWWCLRLRHRYTSTDREKRGTGGVDCCQWAMAYSLL